MSCEICGKTNNLKSCGQCFKANYCGREHQLAHWKDHKRWCIKNRFNYVNNNDINNGQQQLLMRTEFPVENANVNQMNQQQPQSNDEIINIHFNQSHMINTSNNHQNSSINKMAVNGDDAAMSNCHAQMNVTINQQDNNCNFDSSDCQQLSLVNLNDKISNPYPMNPPTNQNIPNIATTNTNNKSFLNNSSLSSFSNPPLYTQNRDCALNNLNKYCHIILKDMNKYGFCVIDDFLQNGDLILNEVSLLYDQGLFQAGQVVNIKANSNSKLIRGDRIIWVEGNEQICNNIGFLIRILDSIITRCNAMAFGEFYKYKINRRTKAMIACYPGNYTKYVRHVDNPNNDGRCITSIYYLNKDYNRERDGGVLRLFPQMNDGIVADIEPRFNRVIFFWSDRRNPHEVMPSTRMRFAITVWYFDANERAKAIQKYKENSMQCPNDKDLVPF